MQVGLVWVITSFVAQGHLADESQVQIVSGEQLELCGLNSPTCMCLACVRPCRLRHVHPLFLFLNCQAS